MCVKLRGDEGDCEILSVEVTPDGRLIVADRNNRNIKMFDNF